MASVVRAMSFASFSTFCMFSWVNPCPMNSQFRSSAALAMGSYAVIAEPLMARTAGTAKSSKTSSIRQKPTRLPYSCHAQFGMSGIGEPPAGGVRTVRGIALLMSHSSTLTITQTASRAPPGSVSFGRSAIEEYAIRSVGSIRLSLRRSDADGQRSKPFDRTLQTVAGNHGGDPFRRARVDDVSRRELVLLRELGDDLRHGPRHFGRRRALAHGGIDLERDRPVAVAHVVGRVHRPARGRVVEGLPHLPGPALVLGDRLQIPPGKVDPDRVAEDMIEGLNDGDVATPNGDGSDRAAIGHDGVSRLLEEERRVALVGALVHLTHVLEIVAADEIDPPDRERRALAGDRECDALG